MVLSPSGWFSLSCPVVISVGAVTGYSCKNVFPITTIIIIALGRNCCWGTSHPMLIHPILILSNRASHNETIPVMPSPLLGRPANRLCPGFHYLVACFNLTHHVRVKQLHFTWYYIYSLYQQPRSPLWMWPSSLTDNDDQEWFLSPRNVYQRYGIIIKELHWPRKRLLIQHKLFYSSGTRTSNSHFL